MQTEATAEPEAGFVARPFETVEIELALEMQEPSAENFDACIRNAAEVMGGEILFEMPADGSLEDASRIAALRVPGSPHDHIVFAILNETADSIRVADPDEVGERFYGFARAFVGVLTRIRDDLGTAAAAA